MRYTWNEIRIRAGKFAEEWSDATRERSESQSFYNEFFEIFGVRRRSVARFEEHVQKLDDRSGFIDLFWPGVLIVEHKSLGGDLALASEQALNYFDTLPEAERPRFRLVSDFSRFNLKDLDTGYATEFTLAELPDNIEQFAFIIGKQRPTHRINQPLNEEAAKLVSKLHSALIETGYPSPDAESMVVRLVFCMFADVTSIFQPRGIFLDLIDAKTSASGEGVGALLARLFETLNKPDAGRQTTIDPDLAQFPYVNGDLFSERIAIAADSSEFRKLLIDAAQFDWSTISPAIFGALFQGVLTPEERLLLGGHPTSEENILRVLDDLFLRDMRAELAELMKPGPHRLAGLHEFWDRLSTTKVFDPACGCGNFLAVTYREIRRIEFGVVEALIKFGDLDPSTDQVCRVDVDQFFGIERRTSSAKITEIAMWMTDHLLNNELSLKLGVVVSRIPLRAAPQIRIGDALEVAWSDVLPADDCTYLIGNPPYKGSKRQSAAERRQVRRLGGSSRAGGTLDYAAGWLFKAAAYATEGMRIAFVVTNSLVQGEQISRWYPIVQQSHSLEISFAHRPFSWDATGAGAAQVDVAVLGFSKADTVEEKKRLYFYTEKSSKPVRKVECDLISPYLLPADNLISPRTVVENSRRILNGARKLVTGSKPIDGGYYIQSEAEVKSLLVKCPAAERYLRPFIGTDEFLTGQKRYILYFGDDKKASFRKERGLREIVEKVKSYRLAEISNKAGTFKLKSANELYNAPTSWHITTVPREKYLIIPEVSSENRRYIPIGWAEPPVIPSNLVKVLVGATIFDFALLTSAMHMAWVRLVGGRLEGRYRYSIGVIYNTFPRPEGRDLPTVEALANQVLEARVASGMDSLEAMYDPLTMPTALAAAHRKLDAKIDRLYRKEAFQSEQERWEFLLNRYAELKSS